MFSQGVKSWRELPLRYADFGVLHRNEVCTVLFYRRGEERSDGRVGEMVAFCLEGEASVLASSTHRVARRGGKGREDHFLKF